MEERVFENVGVAQFTIYPNNTGMFECPEKINFIFCFKTQLSQFSGIFIVF